MQKLHWTWGLGTGLILGLAGCNRDRPAAAAKVPAKRVEPTAVAPAPYAPATRPAGPLGSADTERNTDRDTLRTRGGVVGVRRSSAADFERLAATDPLPAQWPDSLDAPSLAQTGGRVRREGLNLIFKPERGVPVVLRDDTAVVAHADQTVRYLYWGALPAARQWVVAAGLWEGRLVTLIDQRTGRRTDLWGRPAASPDNRYLLSANADLEAQYDPNGLQLFRLDAAGPRLLWERPLQNWGPVRVRWYGARTAVVEQEHLQAENAAGPPAPTYVELELPSR